MYPCIFPVFFQANSFSYGNVFHRFLWWVAPHITVSIIHEKQENSIFSCKNKNFLPTLGRERSRYCFLVYQEIHAPDHGGGKSEWKEFNSFRLQRFYRLRRTFFIRKTGQSQSTAYLHYDCRWTGQISRPFS